MAHDERCRCGIARVERACAKSACVPLPLPVSPRCMPASMNTYARRWRFLRIQTIALEFNLLLFLDAIAHLVGISQPNVSEFDGEKLLCACVLGRRMLGSPWYNRETSSSSLNSLEFARQQRTTYEKHKCHKMVRGSTWHSSAERLLHFSSMPRKSQNYCISVEVILSMETHVEAHRPKVMHKERGNERERKRQSF